MKSKKIIWSIIICAAVFCGIFLFLWKDVLSKKRLSKNLTSPHKNLSKAAILFQSQFHKGGIFKKERKYKATCMSRLPLLI